MVSQALVASESRECMLCSSRISASRTGARQDALLSSSEHAAMICRSTMSHSSCSATR